MGIARVRPSKIYPIPLLHCRFPKSPLASHTAVRNTGTQSMTEGIMSSSYRSVRSVNLVDAHFPQSTRRVEATLCSNVGYRSPSRPRYSLDPFSNFSWILVGVIQQRDLFLYKALSGSRKTIIARSGTGRYIRRWSYPPHARLNPGSWDLRSSLILSG
jgi:hypothetical protein